MRNRVNFTIPWILVATLIALPGMASAQATEPPSKPDEAIEVVGKKICKMETSIGSMMPRRVCRTKTQSKEQERTAAEGIARLQHLQQIQQIQHNTKCQREGC